MTIDEFRASTKAEAPPAGLAGPLAALWHAAKGEWQKAHDLVQDDEGREAAWVHAYLHRVEGDHANAGYWYRRAGKPVPTSALDDEWAATSTILLQDM